MISKIVIDSSAIIALLEQEKGYHIVEENLNCAIISSVNLSEVITVINRKTGDDEMAQQEALKLIKTTFSYIIDFDEEQALIAANLDKFTSQNGLSFGDRACLALAKYKNLPVLTADNAWKDLKLGIKVKLIR
jgi:PIN domain nuclease of toxin-antitoxin system